MEPAERQNICQNEGDEYLRCLAGMDSDSGKEKDGKKLMAKAKGVW